MHKLKSKLWPYYYAGQFLLLRWTGHIPSHAIRNLIYRLFGIQLGVHSVIYSGAEIRTPKKLTIGAGSIIGHGAILDARHGIRIGRNVNFSTGVWIWTLQHDYRDAQFAATGGPVEIDDDAWLSCRVTILPGVRIGRGAVVAAGSVVTKDVEPYAVVGGVPAKKIGERPRDLQYDLGRGRPTPFI